jgi:hypothetical protein
VKRGGQASGGDDTASGEGLYFINKTIRQVVNWG